MKFKLKHNRNLSNVCYNKQNLRVAKQKVTWNGNLISVIMTQSEELLERGFWLRWNIVANDLQ